MKPLALAFVIMIAATSAKAEWIHMKGEDNPFQGGAERLALNTSLSGMTFGFRCVTAGDLVVVLVSTERADDRTAAQLRGIPVKLRVVIDDEPMVEMAATLDTAQDGSVYRASATGLLVNQMVPRVAAAKRRVAVAAFMGDKMIWTSVFDTNGSRRAMTYLSDGCKLELPKS